MFLSTRYVYFLRLYVISLRVLETKCGVSYGITSHLEKLLFRPTFQVSFISDVNSA